MSKVWEGRWRTISAGEICALVATVAHDQGRFTLGDAVRQRDSVWVAYLYDANAGR